MMEANKQITADLGKKISLDGLSILHSLEAKKVDLPQDVRKMLQGKYWGKGRVETEKKLIKILKENDYNAQQIELLLRISNQEIFDIPYDKKERLKAVHPGRMVKLLAKKNCVTKRDPPPILAKLIAA